MNTSRRVQARAAAHPVRQHLAGRSKNLLGRRGFNGSIGAVYEEIVI